MNICRIKLVTFDVTNTILKFRSTPGKQYGEIGALYGALSDDNVLAANFKSQWRKMNREHPNFGLKTGISWQEWWTRIVKGTFANTQFEVPEKKLDFIATHLIDLYKTSACWQPCYGSDGLLRFLKEKNKTLGVISNFDPRLSTTLENTKLKGYFDFILTSYEVGYEKPDTRIFERAMEESKIPNLKPEECLHIGDRALVDYVGARNTRWHAILVNDKRPDEVWDKYPYVDIKIIFNNLYDLHVYFKNMYDEVQQPG
ncbi:Haloacid dehalogenase-like hydrolase [Popillia japonica]|uniref:Haloacid dehalogenase-like hydrolase n=1 Tax=Popillia japonica TaxID=7064 RepID=A0AAW1JJQ4_POPJA